MKRFTAADLEKAIVAERERCCKLFAECVLEHNTSMLRQGGVNGVTFDSRVKVAADIFRAEAIKAYQAAR